MYSDTRRDDGERSAEAYSPMFIQIAGSQSMLHRVHSQFRAL